jgi:hypothetical protein
MPSYSTDSLELFDPVAAGRKILRAPSTLAKDRMKGTGPEFVKFGASVRYTRQALEAYVAKSARRSTSDQGG